MPANFKVPAVEDNADGWGPTTVPEQLEGIPYAPFTKSEKIGRISDFTQSGFNKYGGVRFVSEEAPEPHLQTVACGRPPVAGSAIRMTLAKLCCWPVQAGMARTRHLASPCLISSTMKR